MKRFFAWLCACGWHWWCRGVSCRAYGDYYKWAYGNDGIHDYRVAVWEYYGL